MILSASRVSVVDTVTQVLPQTSCYGFAPGLHWSLQSQPLGKVY